MSASIEETSSVADDYARAQTCYERINAEDDFVFLFFRFFCRKKARSFLIDSHNMPETSAYTELCILGSTGTVFDTDVKKFSSFFFFFFLASALVSIRNEFSFCIQVANSASKN